jgi:chromosome segregation ATPase
MAQDMSFAQALTEAKGLIVQQATRIKGDAEKISVLQQTVVDQCSTVSEQERRLKEQSDTLVRRTQEVAALEERLAETTIAREQAEAIIDRQGQRLTSLQAANVEIEQTVSELQARMAEATRVRDELLSQLPSREDAEALAEMSMLLTTKKVTVPVSEADSSSTSLGVIGPHAEAA